MTMGLLMGLTREGAARFSFLLATHMIFGAALVKLPHLISNPSEITINFIIICILVSFVTGILCIGILLRYVQTKNFLPFAWYRYILGSLVIVIVLIRK